MAVLRRSWDWLERFAADPRKLLLLDVALGLMIAALAVAFVLISLQTHTALCHFREDLQARVDNSDKFIHDNPQLTELRFGPAVVTRQALVAQVESQRATLRSLNDLNC